MSSVFSTSEEDSVASLLAERSHNREADSSPADSSSKITLFSWKSEWLREYTSGQIISFGYNESDARERASKAIKLKYDKGSENSFYGRKRKALLNEVKAEPTRIEFDIAEIAGSA